MQMKTGEQRRSGRNDLTEELDRGAQLVNIVIEAQAKRRRCDD